MDRMNDANMDNNHIEEKTDNDKLSEENPCRKLSPPPLIETQEKQNPEEIEIINLDNVDDIHTEQKFENIHTEQETCGKPSPPPLKETQGQQNSEDEVTNLLNIYDRKNEDNIDDEHSDENFEDESSEETTSGISSPPMDIQEKQMLRSTDAFDIVNMIKEIGIDEFEPEVVDQLLDFTYGYTASVIKDAKMYADHANKENIDKEDVELAIKMKNESNSSPLSQEAIAELARSINDKPLPTIEPQDGIRLPHPRYCTISKNYQLKRKAPKRLQSPPTKIQRIGLWKSHMRDDTIQKQVWQNKCSFTTERQLVRYPLRENIQYNMAPPHLTGWRPPFRYPMTGPFQHDIDRCSPNFTAGRPPLRFTSGMERYSSISSISTTSRKPIIQIDNPWGPQHEVTVKIDLTNENKFKTRQDNPLASCSMRSEVTEDKNLTDADTVGGHSMKTYSKKHQRGEPIGSETETDSEAENQ